MNLFKSLILVTAVAGMVSAPASAFSPKKATKSTVKFVKEHKVAFGIATAAVAIALGSVIGYKAFASKPNLWNELPFAEGPYTPAAEATANLFTELPFASCTESYAAPVVNRVAANQALYYAASINAAAPVASVAPAASNLLAELPFAEGSYVSAAESAQAAQNLFAELPFNSDVPAPSFIARVQSFLSSFFSGLSTHNPDVMNQYPELS